MIFDRIEKQPKTGGGGWAKSLVGLEIGISQLAKVSHSFQVGQARRSWAAGGGWAGGTP